MSAQLPISILNAWARVKSEQAFGMWDAQSAVYAMKRRVILDALKSGERSLRIVHVDRPCKTCEGTGDFKRWGRYDFDYFEYEDCRRCGATGKVKLLFVETNIHGYVWHTPRPKADFLADLRGKR